MRGARWGGPCPRRPECDDSAPLPSRRCLARGSAGGYSPSPPRRLPTTRAGRIRMPSQQRPKSRSAKCVWVPLGCVVTLASWTELATIAAEPAGDLARRLAAVKFEHYAQAPGYSEGPTWRKGEVLFCSGPLWRVDAQRKVRKYLELGPAGTVLRSDGHMVICDNKHKALLDLSPDGRVGVIADQFETQPLRSLNDLTIDARGNVY